MRYALLLVPALVSCEGAPILSPFTPVVEGGATPIETVVAAAPEIIAQAATGQYYAAAITAGSLIAGLLGWKGYKRVKASGAGTLGILAKTDA